MKIQKGFVDMKIPNKELLFKAANSPGLCTVKELTKVRDFLIKYDQATMAYKEVFGEPIGYAVTSALKRITDNLELKT